VYELKSGGVASILREDAGGVADLIFSMIYNPWRAIIQLIGSLTILATVDWKLLLGSLLLLPTVWLTHRTWIGRIRPIFRDIRATRQTMDSHATEAFGGMRVVRSFSRQQAEAATFTRNGHLMARQEIYVWWWSRGIDFTWSVLIPFATAMLLFWGGNRVLSDMEKVREGLLPPNKALTVGDLVMFMSYLAALLGPIASLAGSATALQNSLSGLDRILDLLSESREMPPKPGALVINRDNVIGRITVKNLSFSYTGSPSPVLQDINLDVYPGEMIALVGPSGAGKTTLCNLIARFYDPKDGAILLDNTDLRDITADSYRRLLGIVEQDTFLFDGTIAENIAYGRRGATPDEIQHAAQLANAHEFISKLPNGYDSLIGERGVKLSGGQRQRLTIARAILADPRILILDEATSNLDTESERLIQGSLQTLMAGRTSFVIAHRLSTIAHASRIIVLENGRIIEQGRHDELMQASGRYREMVELQTSPPASPVVIARHAAIE
jgi:ATP-binding cassette subfamily B protein/subfamily B ATP-binding cassette protein MsbA